MGVSYAYVRSIWTGCARVFSALNKCFFLVKQCAMNMLCICDKVTTLLNLQALPVTPFQLLVVSDTLALSSSSQSAPLKL